MQIPLKYVLSKRGAARRSGNEGPFGAGGMHPADAQRPEAAARRLQRGGKMNRTAAVTRNTNETKINLTLNLDGSGKAEVHTGIGFLTIC